MTKLGAGAVRGQRPTADNDVYTVLMLISTLFMLAALIYLIVRAMALFGTVLPPGGS